MKKIFVFDNEIFDSELLVCVGVKLKDVENWAKKNSNNLTDILKVKENRKLIDDRFFCKSEKGCLIKFEKDGLSFYILYLRDFKNTWADLDCLNHEIVHYKQFQWQDRNINNEIEFEAYFQENVFRQLRKKLNSFMKKYDIQLAKET
jgi:hypothetical protein